ncbi:MAG: hypothetical protein ACQESE_01110 [Nanobdellota archaeon]
MRTKGQATIFVILGIVILLVVMLLLSAQQKIIEQRLQQEAEDSIQDFVQLYSINHYVTSCMDTVTTDGLTLLGEQGGVIYESQGGLTPDPSSEPSIKGVHYLPYDHEYTSYNSNGEEQTFIDRRNVSYAIKEFIECHSALYYSPVPVDLDDENTSYYPVKNTYFKDYQRLYVNFFFDTPPGCMGSNPKYRFSGYLGANLIPKLCYFNGSNKPYEEDDTYDPLEQTDPCRWQYYDNKDDPTSMQRQLETYVENNIGNCVDMTIFTKRVGNITVDKEAIKAESILQDPNGLLMKVHYPFDVILSNGNTYNHEVAFQKEFDVNIKTLYAYLFDLFTKMVRQPSFDLMKDWNVSNETTNRYFHSTFELDYDTQACADCSSRGVLDDIITLTDRGSLLDRKPFSMTFAIQNRKPVLNYLNDELVTSEYDGVELDYQFFTNSTITFDPEAIDPDYDNVTYIYKGWKEEYDEILNYTCCQETNDCSLETYHESDCYTLQEDAKPLNWSNSILFQKTGRMASYQSNINDTGYHEVTLVVEDEHGRKDFQIIKLIIFDLPRALLKMANFYDDVNNSFASVEDLYLFNGTASNASNLLDGEIDNYIFRDKTEGFIKNTSEGYVLIEDKPASFSNMSLFNFTKDALDDHQSLRHEISLIVEQNDMGIKATSSPVSDFINVTQCLPHGFFIPEEDEDHSSFSQEYYRIPDIEADEAREIEYYWEFEDDDPYQVPHVCCKPFDLTQEAPNITGGTWIDDKTVCFEKTFNTTYPSLDLSEPYAYLAGAWLDIGDGQLKPYTYERYDNIYGDALSDLYMSGFPENAENLDADDINNIYEVSYKHKCSGSSGKMCAGELDVDWNVIDECNDLENDASDLLGAKDPVARCQGPGMEGNDEPFTQRKAGQDLNGGLVCANFTGKSNYEKDVLAVTADNYDDFSYFNLDNDDAQLIEEGYCAQPENGLSIDADDASIEISSHGKGPFTCQAICADGACGYYNYEFCACGSDGDSECEDIPASKLFVDGKTYEVCIDTSGKTSCDSSCDANRPSSSKGACYCATVGNVGDTVSEDREVDAYFKSLSAIYKDGSFHKLTAYPSFISTPSCCYKDGQIFTSEEEEKVCYDGKVYTEGRIDNDITNADLLASEGKIHCCGETSDLGYCTPYEYGSSITVGSDLFKCEKDPIFGSRWIDQ